MPTLNAYNNDPGYYIRAWTSNLGNINYKLKPAGWGIIESRDNLRIGGQISWQEITALKALGLVFTDDSGVIYPSDEKFQPDPDQVESMNLTEREAREFLATVRENYNLTHDQLIELCRILGIDPPDEDVPERYEPAAEEITTVIKEEIKSQSVPLSNTLSVPNGSESFPTPDANEGDYSGEDVTVDTLVSGPEDVDKDDPEWEEGYDQNTLSIILVGPEAKRDIPADFLIHYVLFDEEQISAWRIQTTQELTWEVRSELYSQIGTMLPTISQELGEIDAAIYQTPKDLDVEFYYIDGKMTTP